jgi:hypothetical protein
MQEKGYRRWVAWELHGQDLKLNQSNERLLPKMPSSNKTTDWNSCCCSIVKDGRELFSISIRFLPLIGFVNKILKDFFLS